MAAQPCTIGDMQAYIDAILLERDFLTVARANSHMEEHMREKGYITSAELRSLGYAPAAEVRPHRTSIVQRENEFAANLKEEMQTLFNQTRDMQAAFDERAAGATADVAASQAQLMTSFEQRNTQLQEHIDTAQLNTIASLELFTVQMAGRACYLLQE